MPGNMLKRTIDEATLILERKNVFKQEDTNSTVLFYLTARSQYL